MGCWDVKSRVIHPLLIKTWLTGTLTYLSEVLEMFCPCQHQQFSWQLPRWHLNCLKGVFKEGEARNSRTFRRIRGALEATRISKPGESVFIEEGSDNQLQILQRSKTTEYCKEMKMFGPFERTASVKWWRMKTSNNGLKR